MKGFSWLYSSSSYVTFCARRFEQAAFCKSSARIEDQSMVSLFGSVPRDRVKHLPGKKR
jgi:hypothetical protein